MLAYTELYVYILFIKKPEQLAESNGKFSQLLINNHCQVRKKNKKTFISIYMYHKICFHLVLNLQCSNELLVCIRMYVHPCNMEKGVF